ncbi:hypothetical protein K466DRAFT_606663 [Polyporus arcularius HHB13444]|uniref:Uncharacterized protein n=1 Tax=Polyporus arcularius HHB13444 TaxID=1314778 RepID=A0A5C3NQY6_9APHY|nr:hypothetical protein K466DRAFT_606663 [Polyporus arcularius HHB13444]
MEVETHKSASIASLMANAPAASVPQKRKGPPASPPSRTRVPEHANSRDTGKSVAPPQQGPSSPDEYNSGYIICDGCGETIPIRDEATGSFTVQHWEAHRSACQSGPAQIPSEKAPPETPATSHHPDASQPQAKRRRAKRTEEERIDYLRSDPYVAKFEAYRVLCASCDKWIRLRPNSTYCSIPWDAHRKSCLAKRVAKNAPPVDDRSAAFAADPNIKRFDQSRVQCRACEKWIPILTDDHATAIKTWKQHRESCQPHAITSPSTSTSKFNIADVPPPSKHLLALASSSSLPPPPSASTSASAPARSPLTHSMSAGSVPASHPSSSGGGFMASFKDYNPNNFSGMQESRRRSADQRAATLRADPYLGEVEPSRVFCKLCHKWVQLRQDSTYCSYPWVQHRNKCLKRRQKLSDREAGIAELRATREAALEGDLEMSDSDGSLDPDDSDYPERERQRVKAMGKEVATARLRQLEGARLGTGRGASAPSPSSEDDDAMWDYMDADSVLPPRLAELYSPAGRVEFVSRSIRHLFRITYERSDELTIAVLVTYLNAAMPPDKHEDFDTAEVTKAMTALHERGAFVFEGDVIRLPS